MMNGHGQSDGEIVPEKFPNKPKGAEGMEERSPAKGNELQHPSHWTQSQTEGMPEVLARIRKAVQRDKESKLTALYHHVYNIEHLKTAYYQLKKKAAAGIDVWKAGKRSVPGGSSAAGIHTQSRRTPERIGNTCAGR
jgi:hypothetical protein